MRTMSTLGQIARRAIFTLFAIGTLALFANAATYTVTNTNDSGAGSLRQAIADAGAAVGDDSIEFALASCPCTITLTSALNVIDTYGLTVNGPGAGSLTVSGNGSTSVFSFVTPGTKSLIGMTIREGQIGVGNFDVGSLTLNGVVVTQNLGSGIHTANGSQLSVIDSTLSHNSGSERGGGISASGTASVSVINSTIARNSTNGRGGGIWVDAYGSLSVVDSIILGNFANSDGGGIYQGGFLRVTNSTIETNSASGEGGGIFSEVGGAINAEKTVERSTLSGNQAAAGGAIMAFSGRFQLINSTVTGNTAWYYGGGIFTFSSPLYITSSTLTANRAHSAGGGVTGTSELSLTNSIVAVNFVGSGDTMSDIGSISSVAATNTLIGDAGGSGGILNGDNGNLVGIDPELGPLQLNGGTTKTHALLPSSPAVNAGGPTDLTTDQRGSGFDRVIGAAADIGAFEVQPACSGIAFAPAANFSLGPEGTDPRSVVAGDFNGDGDLDLATANRNSNNVSVLLGDGAGGFAPAANFGTGNGPRSVAAGDFNADGRLDLATANQNSDNVSVLLGDGNGGFASAASFLVGIFPTSVVAADFDADGNLDLAAAIIDSANLSVLLGDGAGGFAPAANFPVGFGPMSVTTGDFDADGDFDLATANYGSRNVSVLLGNAAGGFAPAANFPVGIGPTSVTGGDFDADGDLDLATANEGSENVSVLLADGNGGFAPAASFSVGLFPSSVVAGDFDADGNLDLAVANRGFDNVSVLLGDGAGGFAAAAANFGAGLAPRFVTTGDFDGNGRLDLAAGNQGASSISVLLNTCGANTAPVASDDSYSTDEDTPLTVAAPGVLGNDTDGENDTLTAVLVDGPANAQSFNLNTDGSFSYTPAANFNGSDSFTYRANDGSVDSEVATVTITVNAVNDPPVISIGADITAQYSDGTNDESTLRFIEDADSMGVQQSISHSVNDGPFVPGLPADLVFDTNCISEVGTSCRFSVHGTANVPANIYTIRITANDGTSSVSESFKLTVTKEHTATEYTGDEYALTAGPTVTTANVRLAAQLTQEADGFPGDITKASVRFVLFKGGNMGSTPDLTVSGVPVDASGAALIFANLPVDTWTVKVKIDADNGYWKASPVGMGTITIEQPTNELRTSGGGWVADSETVNGKGNFGFHVANQKKGVKGSSIYLFRGLDGFNYLVKSTNWNSGGVGFRAEGSIISLAAFSGKCVVQKIDPATGEVVESLGNYSFTVDVRDGDLFKPKQPDKYAITILNSGGLIWRQVGSRTSPPAIGGGNVTVKGR